MTATLFKLLGVSAAAALILVGFVDLARGGIVLAPVALVVGYLVLAPLSFLID